MPDNVCPKPAIGHRSDNMRHAVLEPGRLQAEHEVVEIYHAPKMLIADDDPSIVRLLADHCARMGFDVDTASNGIMALLKAKKNKPDIVVIDVNMPEVDGLTACAHLLRPDRPPVNVIVITGSRDPDTLERCEGFGAHYARKGPNFWNDLESALAEFLPRMAGKIAGSRMLDSPPVRPRPCVLLVDDESDVNRLLASRLANCGIDVACALDAPHGLRMACRDEPAVIVTDYFMPNGDALYFLTRLRIAEKTANIPVIVLSGRQLSEVTVRELRRPIRGHPGVSDILRKSGDASVLFETLQKFCGFEPASNEPPTFRGRLAH
jgi:CheY-like chemotaxis protein